MVAERETALAHFKPFPSLRLEHLSFLFLLLFGPFDQPILHFLLGLLHQDFPLLFLCPFEVLLHARMRVNDGLQFHFRFLLYYTF